MNICVTGASSGIGRELVKQLISEGHTVWGIARRENLLAELKQKLHSNRFFYSVCDVSVPAEVQRSFQDMKNKGFNPDVLILAAGAFLDDIKPEFNYEILRKTVDINLYGALNFVNIFLPEFLARHSGQFIAVSSAAALKPSPRGIGYPASKAALGITFRGLDLAYRSKNVIFSTIFLGPVATEMLNARRSFIVATKEKIAASIIKTIKTKKSVRYIPFWSTLIFRLNFLPDKLYITLTEIFR